jgi:SNF2 family DNA or RNA helicase
MTPSHNQQTAIEKLSHYKVGALFMEAGTGKTYTAYELIKGTQVDVVVFITPCQNKGNIENEIAKYGGLSSCHVIGIESISQSNRVYLETRALLENSKSFLIVDESLKIKNFEALRTKRIIDLGSLATYKLILNGTPITKNLLDLWSQMEFLSPKILGMNYTQFKNTFCEYVKVTKRISKAKAYTKEFIVKYHNVAYLCEKIKPYVYECDLSLLVQQQYHTLHYELDEELLERYNHWKETYLDNEKMQALNNNIFLEMTQKMQHSYCLSSQKFDCLDLVLKKHEHNKVIVFCKFVASANAIREKHPQITVLTYGKHAFGLNLQHKSVTVYFDKTFDYAMRVQSERRTYRTLQQDNCYYYDLTGNVGLERLIDDNISRKVSLLESFKVEGNKIVERL